MPGLDGIEALERIKTDPAMRHIPVIMISGIEDNESVVRCLEAGADDFLPKPFDPRSSAPGSAGAEPETNCPTSNRTACGTSSPGSSPSPSRPRC